MAKRVLYSGTDRYSWHPCVLQDAEAILSHGRFGHVSQCNLAGGAIVIYHPDREEGCARDTEENTEWLLGQYDFVLPQRCEYRVAQIDEWIVRVDEGKFVSLRDKWHEERGATSSVSEMISCRSYLSIIGMGKRAIPLILKQIEREGEDPDHWFAALSAITEEDPVPEDAYGDTVKMAEAWLSWAKERHDW